MTKYFFHLVVNLCTDCEMMYSNLKPLQWHIVHHQQCVSTLDPCSRTLKSAPYSNEPLQEHL
jgi:hypothetical protein